MGRKAVGGPVVEDPQLGKDPAFLQALLQLYRHVEFAELLQTGLNIAVDWKVAEAAFGLGPGEDRASFAPLVCTVSRDDPRHKAFTRLDTRQIRAGLGSGIQVFDGLGPLTESLPRWPGPPPGACVSVPLLDEQKDWAGLLLLVGDQRPAEDQLERFTRLLEMSRPAVGHALQLLAMRELVIKDDTANCFNRRYFEEFLPEELSRAGRFRAPLSLIFLDMDNLKEVNNRHGHSMGSRTLHEVSTRIRVKIRKFDRLFRFGGDEFCILLPETEWHGALEVAERVRDAIADQPFLVDAVEGKGVKMTASLGIASYPLHARTQRDLVQEADRAMQRVKQSTKNAIGIAELTGENDEG